MTDLLVGVIGGAVLAFVVFEVAKRVPYVRRIFVPSMKPAKPCEKSRELEAMTQTINEATERMATGSRTGGKDGAAPIRR